MADRDSSNSSNNNSTRVKSNNNNNNTTGTSTATPTTSTNSTSAASSSSSSSPPADPLLTTGTSIAGDLDDIFNDHGADNNDFSVDTTPLGVSNGQQLDPFLAGSSDDPVMGAFDHDDNTNDATPTDTPFPPDDNHHHDHNSTNSTTNDTNVFPVPSAMDGTADVVGSSSAGSNNNSNTPVTSNNHSSNNIVMPGGPVPSAGAIVSGSTNRGGRPDEHTSNSKSHESKGRSGKRTNASSADREAEADWHDEIADMPHRRELIRQIADLLRNRKKNPTQKWIKELPYKARKLEEQLYKTAQSLEAYLDKETLKARLKQVAHAITRRYRNEVGRPRKGSERSSSLISIPSSALDAFSSSLASGTSPSVSNMLNNSSPLSLDLNNNSNNNNNNSTNGVVVGGSTNATSSGNNSNNSSNGNPTGNIADISSLEQQQAANQRLQEQMFENIRQQQQIMRNLMQSPGQPPNGSPNNPSSLSSPNQNGAPPNSSSQNGSNTPLNPASMMAAATMQQQQQQALTAAAAMGMPNPLMMQPQNFFQGQAMNAGMMNPAFFRNQQQQMMGQGAAAGMMGNPNTTSNTAGGISNNNTNAATGGTHNMYQQQQMQPFQQGPNSQQQQQEFQPNMMQPQNMNMNMMRGLTGNRSTGPSTSGLMDDMSLSRGSFKW